MRNETGKGKTILSLTRLSVKNYLSDNLPADTHAVLRALPNIMADFMKESRAVHFEGLGWFRYTTVSAGNGVATKEEVSSDQITGLRVQFTPDRTRNMSGGYTRALVADEGITFMEWLGKESDETQVPEDNEDDEDESQTENPME
ncbi:HU family DNA-binding protein [Phocaeicola intestinalis]|uniref:HU family DNA-binding protein n=1 Tax=Phocaeicola intestinalis TaxID=2762212 RepID=UPI00293BA7ED|nr:DNA-binding protein [Phocaeicola intestinalis]